MKKTQTTVPVTAAAKFICFGCGKEVPPGNAIVQVCVGLELCFACSSIDARFERNRRLVAVAKEVQFLEKERREQMDLADLMARYKKLGKKPGEKGFRLLTLRRVPDRT